MRGFKTVNTLYQCKNKYSSASYFFFYNLLYKLEIRLHADSYHINEIKGIFKRTNNLTKLHEKITVKQKTQQHRTSADT